MEHGCQADGYSCGIILGNTIEHAINATPIWEQQREIIERLRWFRRFSKGINWVDGVFEEDMASSQPSEATKDMMSENVELSISIALGDHNFPDLAQFALGSSSDSEGENDSFPDAPALASRSHLFLNEILNPESGGFEHETDYIGSKLDTAKSNSDGLGQSSDMTDADLASGVGSQTSAMDTDQAYELDESMSLKEESGGVIDTSSGGDLMDIHDDHGNNLGVIPNFKPQSKAQSTLRSFFQPKNKMESKDKAKVESGGEGGENRHLKRPRVLSDTDSNASDESEDYRMRKGKVRRSEGTSRSAKASRARREKLRQGKLTISKALFEQWKQKILADDPNVEFHPTDIRSVRHSICGRKVLMKEACDATRWRTHLKGCKVSGRRKKAGAGMPTLLKMGFESVKAVGSRLIEKKPIESTDGTHCDDHQSIPCPGITEANDPRVPTYLRRTSALGGGARSVKVIAGEVYNKLFSILGKAAKQDVLDRQQHEHKWQNDHHNLRVFAVACERTLPPHKVLVPCNECMRVLSSKAFKHALQKPLPEEKNYIYTNHRFRSPLLGQIYARSIGLKELIENPVLSFLLGLTSKLLIRSSTGR